MNCKRGRWANFTASFISRIQFLILGNKKKTKQNSNVGDEDFLLNIQWQCSSAQRKIQFSPGLIDRKTIKFLELQIKSKTKLKTKPKQKKH